MEGRITQYSPKSYLTPDFEEFFYNNQYWIECVFSIVGNFIALSMVIACIVVASRVTNKYHLVNL